MKRKRILAWVLTLVLLLGIFPLPMASAAGTSTYQGKTYSTDYTTWRQADPAWGSTALGDLHTMAGSGCLVTSIAILMCHAGVYDPASSTRAPCGIGWMPKDTSAIAPTGPRMLCCPSG